MLIFYLIKNKMKELLIYIFILLVIFFLVNCNQKNKRVSVVKESFTENKLTDYLVNEKKTNSYPLIVNAKDVPQLF